MAAVHGVAGVKAGTGVRTSHAPSHTHTSGAVISLVWVLHLPVTSIFHGALAFGTHPVPRGDSGGPPAPPSGILSMAKGFNRPGNQLSSLAFHSVNVVMRLVTK